MTKKKELIVSRKNFLTYTGASLAGFALVSSMGSLLAGCASQEAASPGNGQPENSNSGSNAFETPQLQVPEWPYPYKRIDPDKAAERAYNVHSEGFG